MPHTGPARPLAMLRSVDHSAGCNNYEFRSLLLPLETLQIIPALVSCKTQGANHMLYGYARVSTRDQDLTGQVTELTAAGCAKVFTEKASGAKGDRAELAKVLRKVTHGDVLVVTRLDRLARSTRDLLNVIDAVTKKGSDFKSLRDTWADTTTAHGRLMVTVLGGLAEFERELIRARTGEGRTLPEPRSHNSPCFIGM